MNDADRDEITLRIAPALAKGEISLLLGAGFSVVNTGGYGLLPSGEQLKERLLTACGKTSGPKTTLKDAYVLARRSMQNFEEYFAKCFTVESVFPWQEKIFQYPWARIYTTNIDNVLDVAAEACKRAKRSAGDFRFFNYIDVGHVSATIGALPVVTIHGTCRILSDGFVFSSLEYARTSHRRLDWHNDLAARMIAGGVVVIGNQLDESDIDTYVSRREESYGTNSGAVNWIVTPNPDPIKAENWRSSGFYVVDAYAEDFFNAIFSALAPLTVGDVVIKVVPTAKRAVTDIKAMTWFKGTFKLAFTEIEHAQKQNGLLKHFITGADPEWFYIVNHAHAQTEKSKSLLNEIASLMQANSTGVGLLHVIGPSGSGKSTAIKNALLDIVHTYKYVYEFSENQSIDKEYLRTIIDRFAEKSIFVFYSASDYYFAVKEVANRPGAGDKPYCLFVLEARTNDHNKSRRQLIASGVSPRYIELGVLQSNDAVNIAKKIEDAGLSFMRFSEYPLNRRAQIILDKEKGYGGDLLSALYSLTTNENFEQKIFQDYHSADDGLQRDIVNLVSIFHSLGFSVPVDYVAGSLGEKVDEVTRCIIDELAGVVLIPEGTSVVKCRHRVIASYYFDNYIAGKGKVDMLGGTLEFLSRQFTVDDIKYQPLTFRIYRDLISFEFIYDRYFPAASRDTDCERLYHEAQKYFGRDGVFWLHFGRYYRKIDRFSAAIDCFRTGLYFYDSFQTRHSLGMTLVEKYIYDDAKIEDYDEGIAILEKERTIRGVADAYPTTTMLTLLTRIVEIDAANQDARDRAKQCLNFGLKNFRDDEHFTRASGEYMRVERNLSY